MSDMMPHFTILNEDVSNELQGVIQHYSDYRCLNLLERLWANV